MTPTWVTLRWGSVLYFTVYCFEFFEIFLGFLTFIGWLGDTNDAMRPVHDAWTLFGSASPSFLFFGHKHVIINPISKTKNCVPIQITYKTIYMYYLNKLYNSLNWLYD